MERKEPTKSPTMQDVKAEMEGSDTYTKIFPEIRTQVILYLACSPSGNGCQMFI